MSSETPRSTSAFLDSIAVNTHVGYGWAGYNNLYLVTQSMNYLGVDTMRTALTTIPDALPVVQQLAAQGYKFDFVVSSGLPSGGEGGIGSYVGQLATFVSTHPGSVVAVEGLNEANLQHFSYNGSSSMEAAAAFQTDYYQALKSNAALKDIPVYNLTLGHDDAGAYAALGNLSGSADYANAHAYVSTNSTVAQSLARSLGLSEASAGTTTRSVITETGYTTLAATADVGASESAQAKNILNTLVEAFKEGVAQTYVYELLDRGNDPAMTDKEAHFGLFHADGSPKLAAQAIHNMTWILGSDSGGQAQAGDPPSYSLAGLPKDGGSMMLAKANGAFDLVVWNAPKVWDDANDKDIVNPQVPVTVSLGQTAAKVYVYDPLGGSSPIAVYENVSQIVLPISDHPLIVEIGGPGPRAAETVATPAIVEMSAQDLVANFATLNASATLEKIVLTDGHDLQIASKPTLDYLLTHFQSALSKISGDVTFTVTQQTSDWRLAETYDEQGHLVSRTDAGLADGLVVTQQTKFVDGAVHTINYDHGVKTSEVSVASDGSRETYQFGITGQAYQTEHARYDVGGNLLVFERLHADGSTAFSEVRAAGSITASWYDPKGVIVSQAVYGPDGSVTSRSFDGGVLSRSYEQRADHSQVNASYGLAGQGYAIEVQTLNAAGKVVDVLRSHADGSPAYHWQQNLDGSALTTSFDASGHKLSDVTDLLGGGRHSDLYVASTGLLDRQIDQRPDGYFATTVYAAGVKTALYVAAADGSQQAIFYDAKGLKTSESLTGTDGSVTSLVYAGGILSRAYELHADRTQVNTAYGITGQSYTTEVQTLNATGRVVDVLRSHADGSSAYHWQQLSDGSALTVSYDASGHKLSEVTDLAGGGRLSNLYVASTGALDRQIEQHPDGYFATTVYTAGVKTTLYITAADGSQQAIFYDGNGLKSSETLTGADGSVTTHNYVNGVLASSYEQHADHTQVNASYGITGQSYTSEVQTLNASGHVVDVLRSHADGSSAYHWQQLSDGSALTVSFDATGHKLSEVTDLVGGGRLSNLYVASTGALDRQIEQHPDGYFATTVYTSGVKSAFYATASDGSQQAISYDAGGLKSSETLTAADGSVTSYTYVNGNLSRAFEQHADHTQLVTTYGITGQPYTTEVQMLDASGKVVDVLRSHADGSSAYHWQQLSNGGALTTTFDAAGHKLSDVTDLAGGGRISDLYVASTGALDRQIEQHPDGYFATTIYTASIKTAQFITNADGSSQNATFGITGQSYVSELQKLDAGGRVVDVLRTHADGSSDYHWQHLSNGDAVTTTFDSVGTKTLEILNHADGSKEVSNFALSGQPGAKAYELYNSSGALQLVDTTHADGSHEIYATASGGTIQSGTGNDKVYLFGDSSFVFAGGHDEVNNFHADESVAHHDVIEVSRSLASGFDHLQFAAQGSDVLVTFNDHDSLLLKGVAVGQVTAADFLFV